MLSDTVTFEVRSGPDGDGDGLLDSPFASLTGDGDQWTGDADGANGRSRTQMATWFGVCEGADSGVIHLRVANPADGSQALEVSVPRRLVACGEQGIAILRVAGSAAALLTPGQGGTLPPAPEGWIAGTPYFSVAVLVSRDGGAHFEPIDNAAMASAPAGVSLSGLTAVPSGAGLTSYPLNLADDGAGNVAMTLPPSAWSGTFIGNVVSDGISMQGTAKGAAVFAAFEGAGSGGTVPEKEEGVSCAPGRAARGGGLLADLALILAVAGTLLYLGRKRLPAAHR